MARTNIYKMLRVTLLLLCLIYIAQTNAVEVNGTSNAEARSLSSEGVGKCCISLHAFIEFDCIYFYSKFIATIMKHFIQKKRKVIFFVKTINVLPRSVVRCFQAITSPSFNSFQVGNGDKSPTKSSSELTIGKSTSFLLFFCW